jgi:hypothetical protein
VADSKRVHITGRRSLGNPLVESHTVVSFHVSLELETWHRHPIFSMISTSVAPFFRCRSATTWAVLLTETRKPRDGAFRQVPALP